MKQYLFSVIHAWDRPMPPEEEMLAAFARVEAFNTELVEAGAWVFGGGLHPPSSATVVRQGADGVLVTDGPFAETKEQLGGFWVVKADDLDAALAWAEKGSLACGETLEVRPFQDEPED